MKPAIAGVLAAFVLAAGASPVLAQSDPTGVWEISIVTPQGTTPVTLTLKREGSDVTGEVVSGMGSAPLHGTFKDGVVDLVANIDIAYSPQVNFAGKIDDDAISGAASFGFNMDFTFSGRRVAAQPAAAASTGATSGATVDVSGKWDVVLAIDGVSGDAVKVTLTQEDDKVTGTLRSELNEVWVDGTVAGDVLTLRFSAPTGDGSMPVTMTGALRDDQLTGKATLGRSAQAEWKGTRSK